MIYYLFFLLPLLVGIFCTIRGNLADLRQVRERLAEENEQLRARVRQLEAPTDYLAKESDD